MLFYICFTLVFYAEFRFNNSNFKIKEPFNSLFTQGMVCHETYKDENE